MPTYANENWTKNRSDKKKIESAEIKFLRSVSSWIYSRRSKRKYRHTFRIKNIQFNRENRKPKRKLAWTHFNNDNSRLPKVLLNYKPRGYRNIGRPIARREDAFCWSRKQACGLYPWSRRRKIRRNIDKYRCQNIGINWLRKW
jgi:hypothetical protein